MGYLGWFMGALFALLLALFVFTLVEHQLYVRRSRKYELDRRWERDEALRSQAEAEAADATVVEP